MIMLAAEAAVNCDLESTKLWIDLIKNVLGGAALLIGMLFWFWMIFRE